MFRLPIRWHYAAAALAAAFAVSGSGMAAQAAGGWQASEDDALLFQVKAQKFRLEGDVRGYRTDRGFCVDLADIIQTLDLPVRLDKKSRRATGWLFAEERSLTIDRDSNTVQIVNKQSALAAGEIYDTPEGWCVDTDTLANWFEASVKADPYNSVLVIEGDQKMPFIQALERRSRAARLRPSRSQFDLSTLPQADVPYQAWRTPAVDLAVNFKFDQTPTGSKTTASYELFASGEVLGVSFDARLASDQDGSPSSLRMEAYRYDPDGGLLGPLKATRVAIGDVQTDGASLAGASGLGRGAVITNRPLIRPTSFSRTTLRGAMPAGWDAELYRNGQLIAFQGGSTDGRYEFIDIDLFFGLNDFEVVLYGPQGQIRREASSFPVGIESISPGKTEYWAAVIEQGHDLLEFNRDIVDPNTGWRWGVGVERGIDDRTSLAFSAQSMVVRDVRRTFLEANLRRAVGPMLVELSAAQSLGRGRAYRAQALGRVGRFNFEMRTLWVDGDFESDIIEPYLRGEMGFSVNTSLKLGRMRMPIEVGARQERRRDGSKVNEWLIRSSLVARGLSLTAELGQIWTDGPGIAGVANDGLYLNLLANTRIGRADVRGESRFRLSGPNSGFESARITADIPLTERSDLRAQLEYYGDYDRANFSLGYIREFKQFAIQADARIGTDGSFGAGLALSFSFGPDPTDGGIRFSKEKLARTGQTAVTVFLDENGDGKRSAGEKPVPDVAVAAGMRISEGLTDENGKVIVEGMRPYVPVLLSIDTGSLPDPFLQPNGKGLVVTPRPGVAAEIELPLSPTGEVEGSILGPAGTAIGGVELELVDQLGQVIDETTTEYDGYFLFDMVPYGRYTLRVAAKTAKVLEVNEGLVAGIVVSQANELARVGIVKLQSNSTKVAAFDATRPADSP